MLIGKPGVSTHMVLQNRRHVLTQNTEGVVALWDLVNVRYTFQIKRVVVFMVNDFFSSVFKLKFLENGNWTKSLKR